MGYIDTVIELDYDVTMAHHDGDRISWHGDDIL